MTNRESNQPTDSQFHYCSRNTSQVLQMSGCLLLSLTETNGFDNPQDFIVAPVREIHFQLNAALIRS